MSGCITVNNFYKLPTDARLLKLRCLKFDLKSERILVTLQSLCSHSP